VSTKKSNKEKRKHAQKLLRSVEKLEKRTPSASPEERYFGLESPHEGSFSNMIVFEDIKKAFRYEIESLREQLENLARQRERLLEELRVANMEFEKMKYLESEEIKKFLKAKAQREAKDLDEIGVMLYNNREAK
jgi:regulator of replication initiation timing